MKVRINADDFGISPGVNDAIIEMYRKKKLHSASLILGCKYADQAISLAKHTTGLKIGLHFNLTTGEAQSAGSSTLVDKHGRFKYGFISLLLLSLFKRDALIKAVTRELEAQLSVLKNTGIVVHHIDSHRHVHIIPAISQVVMKVAKKYRIKTIRSINEDFFCTWGMSYKKSFLFDGGIIKFLVLKLLSLFNEVPKHSEYFFSILYSCTISRELISKIRMPKQYNTVEIMIHPGNPEKDDELLLEEKIHLISKKRRQECL